MEANEALDRYSELVKQEEEARKTLEFELEALIPKQLRDRMLEIRAEREPQLQSLQAQRSELEDKLKEYVLQVGETLKGKEHMFVFSKGRVSWDTKSLEGYVKAHPELLVFRSEGKPSVSIRKVG